MTGIDTSMYKQAIQNQNQDPLSEMTKMMQLRNAMGNINKMQGGQPGTDNALDQLGAGQQYAPTDTNGEQ